MKQVAIFEKNALASKETFNHYYSQANKFATLANGSYANYQAAVDTMGVYSHPMDKVLESTSSFGAIDNAKEVTRWIFDNKPGKVSNIITVNNNFFFIATVKGVHKEGFATVEEAAPVIRQQLYAEKLGEKKTAEVAEKIKGLDDLQAIAEALGTTVSTQEDITFASMRGQGLDPAFIGAACAAPEGKVCGPVQGQIGSYVFKVTGRDTGAFYTEDDAKNYQAQKSQYMSQMILPVMMEVCDVKDNRARFY
jgi:peptidyl-prolyl cis-trans isomerase D